MPKALEQDVKDKVKQLWLSSETRKNIAAECGIGAGSVTNIAKEWKMNLESSDYESMRELGVQLKKEGLNFAELGAIYRFHNYIKKLGDDFCQIESFIANIANSQDPQKLIDTADEIAQLSPSESISLDRMGDHIKQQQEEKHTLEEEVEKAREILKQTNVDIQTVKEYKRLEDELNKSGLSISDPHNLVSILKKFKKMRYDPRAIVTEISCVRSLKQHEKQLENSCKMLKLRASRYKEIIPLCEQLLPLGIGFTELTAFHAAVMKKSDSENLPMSTAAYHVIEDIENYNKLGGMKEQLIKVGNQLFLINDILGRKNNAINAVMKLQAYGVTDNEILNFHEFMNRTENVARISHIPFDTLRFNSYDLNLTNNRSNFGAPKFYANSLH
jgi:hypothetical protein